jgi:hypothetical protein
VQTVKSEQIEAARRLDVPLDFGESPIALARLTQLVAELMRRLEALEKKQRR